MKKSHIMLLIGSILLDSIAFAITPQDLPVVKQTIDNLKKEECISTDKASKVFHGQSVELGKILVVVNNNNCSDKNTAQSSVQVYYGADLKKHTEIANMKPVAKIRIKESIVEVTHQDSSKEFYKIDEDSLTRIDKK